LKSGFLAKDSKMRNVEQLAHLIAMTSILVWQVLWPIVVNRKLPELPAKLVFTDTEIKLLERMVPLKDESRRKTVGIFLLLLARSGDYLNRTVNM